MRAIGGFVLVIIAVVFWILISRGCNRVADNVIDQGINVAKNTFDKETIPSSQLELNPLEVNSNPSKFASDALTFYQALFTKQKDWVDLVVKNNIDVKTAVKCSAENLTGFLRSFKTEEIERLTNKEDYSELISVMAVPAMSCFQKQMKNNDSKLK